MERRGVAPVVGLALMIVIVAMLAAIVGAMTLGVTDQLEGPGPQVALTVSEYAPEGDGNGGKPFLLIHHHGGDIADSTDVYIVDGDGNRVAWADVWTTGPKVGPGSYAHVDGCGTDGALNRVTEEGQVYKIVFESENGETRSIREVSVPSPPDPKPC